MTLKVLKFGGSSVGGPPALLRAAEITRRELPSGGLVVVSALKGTTDLILDAVQAASRGELAEAKGYVEALRGRHQQVAHALGLLGQLETTWDGLFGRLGALVQGMALVWEAPARSRDAALAVGETLSAHLFAALLQREGTAARFADVREVLHTDDRFGRARPRLAALRASIRPWKARLQSGEWIVTQGFLGAAPDGATTTLGRGGSDTSATLLGEALGADEVQIWTDVDGVLTADPSLVPGARPLPRLSLAEATALSAFGAKVLHADSLAPVGRAGFRLKVANTLRPGTSVTEIAPEPPFREAGEVTSVAYKEGLSLLRFAPGVDLEELARLLSPLEAAGAARYGLGASPEGAWVALRPETPAARAALAVLEEEGAQREDGWALVALVGEGLRQGREALLARLPEVAQGPIRAFLSHPGGLSLAFLVPESDLAALIPALHEAFIAEPDARTA